MSTHLGTIGETTVKLFFLRQGLEVYIGDDCTSSDLLTLEPKTGKVQRVEVKTTRRRNKNNDAWIVDIRRSYGDLDFDPTMVDLLAVFIEPKNEIRFFNSGDVKSKTQLTIPDTES